MLAVGAGHHLRAGALIADGRAIENRPAADGSIFVVSERRRDIALRGMTIHSRSGATQQ